MCGIAGFVDLGRCVDDPASTLRAMAAALAHRGPDDERIAFDEATRVGFAFRRLAVLDLSPTGAQPMRSASGRFEIVFNGEVYNHPALRDELAAGGARFTGASDTETMLAAFEAWGVAQAIPRLSGMFAFAVLDRTERALWLVRDRFGVKPLYVGRARDARTVVFASELKALRAVGAMRLGIDRAALAGFLERGCVQGEACIHPEVRRLGAGKWLRIDLASGRHEERAWWSTGDEMRAARARGFAGSERDAIDAVDAAVAESVRLRMLSDVPVGALLSGGIDSSVVVAAMQSISRQRVRTFTVGFDEAGFDESERACAVAAHLGTDHTEIRVGAREALDLVPRLPEVYDEPFADSSQIPTMLVCVAARRSVTVALSGDGGDELFAGYYRHEWIARIVRRTGRMPRGVRRLAGVLRVLPRGVLDAIGGALSVDRAGDRVEKLLRAMRHDDPAQIYAELLSAGARTRGLVLGAPTELAPAARWPMRDPAALLDRVVEADLAGYLPDDILVKVDRASMACGLEAREPLLDQDLARLAFSLPAVMKIRGGERKWILRRVLERRVPAALFDRPKMGFAVPLAAWLRGPLRDWAESLLAEDRLRAAGYLDAGKVRAIWRETVDQRGRSDGAAAWNVLMFEAWRERWGH